MWRKINWKIVSFDNITWCLHFQLFADEEEKFWNLLFSSSSHPLMCVWCFANENESKKTFSVWYKWKHKFWRQVISETLSSLSLCIFYRTWKGSGNRAEKVVLSFYIQIHKSLKKEINFNTTITITIQYLLFIKIPKRQKAFQTRLFYVNVMKI